MDSLAYYRDLLAKHGPTHQAVDAGSEESHARRLRVLAGIVPHWHATVLDVGCGVGHLIDYGMMIEKAGYRGIDILPEMIAAARLRHPSWRFEVGDITKPDEKWQADYVLASGLFQFDGSFILLNNMYTLCRKGMAVNYLRKGTKDEFVSDPGIILQDVLTLTPYVALHAHYLPNDFTVYLYKEKP